MFQQGSSDKVILELWFPDIKKMIRLVSMSTFQVGGLVHATNIETQRWRSIRRNIDELGSLFNSMWLYSIFPRESDDLSISLKTHSTLFVYIYYNYWYIWIQMYILIWYFLFVLFFLCLILDWWITSLFQRFSCY